MDDLQSQRSTWLASGDEAEMPIVDAHHHFWDIARNPHPWLQSRPRIAFRYGDYEAICRDFLPGDYARAAAPHRVLRNVVMEGEWDSADPVGEARWMAGLAERSGTPHAMAAQVAAQAVLHDARRVPGGLGRTRIDALPTLARRLRAAARCGPDVRAAGALVAHG